MANIGSLTATLGIDTRGLAKAERTFRGVMSRMKNQVFSLKGALIALGGAFVLHELKKGIMDITHMAGRYEELGVAMKVAGQNAGFSADEMSAFQKSVESMGIAAIEARQTLLRMSVAGIDLSKSMQLARAAQDLAVVGAINSSEAFERLIYGIQTGQVRVLRTIGLNLTFEEGYKRLAKEMGKTTEELTAQEKMQSRVNAVLKEAVKFQGLYEEAMTSAEKQFRSLQRHIDNFKVSFGKAFQPAYLKAVELVTKAFKYFRDVVSDPAFQTRVQTIADRVIKVFEIMISRVKGIFSKLTEVFTGENFGRATTDALLGIVSALKIFAFAGAAASDAVYGLRMIGMAAIGTYKYLESAILRVHAAFNANNKEYAKRLRMQAAMAYIEADTWGDRLAALAAEGNAMGKVHESFKSIDTDVEKLKKKWEEEDRVAQDYIKTVKELGVVSKESIAGIEEITGGLTKGVEESFKKLSGKGMEGFGDLLKAAKSAVEEATKISPAQAAEIKSQWVGIFSFEEAYLAAKANLDMISSATKETTGALELFVEKEAEKIAKLRDMGAGGDIMAQAMEDAEENIREYAKKQQEIARDALKQRKDTEKQGVTLTAVVDSIGEISVSSGQFLDNWTKIPVEEKKSLDELKEYEAKLKEVDALLARVLNRKRSIGLTGDNLSEGGMKSFVSEAQGGILPSFTKGGFLQHFPGGGIMSGYSSHDKYLAAFRGGEAFISPERVQQYGKSTIQSIIDGSFQRPTEQIIVNFRTDRGDNPIVVQKSATLESLLEDWRRQELLGGT